MSDFPSFCGAVRASLKDAPFLDPAMAAAADLLARRDKSAGQWFECEISHLARQTDDLHSALGARALLNLWSAAVAVKTM
jgi:hypothetical protein